MPIRSDFNVPRYNDENFRQALATRNRQPTYHPASLVSSVSVFLECFERCINLFGLVGFIADIRIQLFVARLKLELRFSYIGLIIS